MKTKRIVKDLNGMGYYFNEMDSRMNYGLIGQLKVDDDIKVLIFPECIYVCDKNTAITNLLLSYIKKIQVKFKELKKHKNHMGAHTEGIIQEH